MHRLSAPLRGTVIDFGRNDMVPHVVARKTHQLPQEFSYITPKGVFQHNREASRREIRQASTPDLAPLQLPGPCLVRSCAQQTKANLPSDALVPVGNQIRTYS